LSEASGRRTIGAPGRPVMVAPTRAATGGTDMAEPNERLHEALLGYEQALAALHQAARALGPEANAIVTTALEASDACELAATVQELERDADLLRGIADRIRAILDCLSEDATVRYDRVYRTDHV
jgi:hypothetical protein